MGNRYTGKLHAESAGYGFIMNPLDSNGRPPPDFPNGSGVFLRASEAKRRMKGIYPLITNIDGETLSFDIRESERFPGKVEACNIDIAH